MIIWISYLAGAVLALAYKLIQHRYRGGSIVEYFFSDRQSSLTTITTFGVIWMLGAVAIKVFSGELAIWVAVAGLPIVPTVFVIGSVAEFAAPRWIARIIDIIGGDQ